MVVRTLVADDSADLVRTLTEVLDGERGIEVVATTLCGEDALRLAEQLRPDVAILDVDMPGGGAELVRGLRSLRPAPRVLIFTGRDEADLVVRLLAAGASAFIAKGSLAGDFASCVLRCSEGAFFVLASCADEVLSRLAGPSGSPETPGGTDALAEKRP